MSLLTDIKTFQDLSNLLGFDHEWLKEQLFRVEEQDKYHQFNIPKRTGGYREITAPCIRVMELQKRLNKALQEIYLPKSTVHGFVYQRNIVTNARHHCGKKFVLNIDIKDFFPSITQKRIRGMLMSPPYNLTNQVATTISHICCFQGQLPQGAPTSPVISNMVCGKLDSELRLLAKQHRCFYTRYADDITFSTTIPKFPSSLARVVGPRFADVVLSDDLIAKFTSNGFQINFKKVRIQREHQRQEVTGLTVNHHPNVSRKYIRRIRAMLYDWDNNGYSQAAHNYHRISGCRAYYLFSSILRGKIEFVGQVRGKDDHIYTKFLRKYESLLEREKLSDKLNFDNRYYNEFCESIDDYVYASSKRYIETQSINRELVIEGFEELQGLKRGRDPDYSLPGVPLAYAFQYLPRKIIAMAAVLSHFLPHLPRRRSTMPKNILDIGSGSDAVSIALGLLIEKNPIEVTAVEPSASMRRFAQSKPKLPNLNISNIHGSLRNLSSVAPEKNHYNFIFMSSVLQNAFSREDEAWWQEVARILYKASTNPATLILIEPTVKENLIQRMGSAMSEAGWILKETTYLSELFPRVGQKYRELERMTDLQKEIAGNHRPYPVETWNTYYKYDECIHVYTKELIF